jgi:hypothetical protein
LLNVFDVAKLSKLLSYWVVEEREQGLVVPSQMIILSTKIDFDPSLSKD